MSRVLILYYSRTGNTKKMADAFAEGASSIQGVEVQLKYYESAENLAGFDAIVIGTPTYNHDMTTDIKKLLEEAAAKNISLKGKVGAAFGSYGWSGEAPQLVLEILTNKFEMNTPDPPLLVKYTPDKTGLEICREHGRKISRMLIS